MANRIQEPTGRSDALRNREAVIEAALAILGDDPSSSMATIAERSGLGRTTVYRHFPGRSELIAALFERAIAEAQEVTSAVTDADRPADVTLRALGPALIEIADRYRFLHGNQHVGEELIASRVRDPDLPVRRFLAAARERGEIDPGLPIAWGVAAITGLAITTATEMNEGRIGRDEAGRILGETLVRAFAADPA